MTPTTLKQACGELTVALFSIAHLFDTVRQTDGLNYVNVNLTYAKAAHFNFTEAYP